MSARVLALDENIWVDALSPTELLAVVCPEIRDRPAHPAPVAAGALVLWREELRCGVRTKLTFDALYRAACREASGMEALRDGLPVVAGEWFADAERVIIEAAKDRHDRRRQAA